MKQYFCILVLSLALLFPSFLVAQDNQFFIDGQLRARGELRASSTDDKPSYGSFINERARLGLGYGNKWLSGNQLDQTKAGFNPLYGTHHKFYGLIDYYYVNTVPVYGLIDPYVSGT